MTIAALTLFTALTSATPLAAPGPGESELKAAYVLNILRFSSRKGQSLTADLHLCLIRPGVIEPALKALDGTSVQGRRLRVRNAIKGVIEGCDVLFFGDLTGVEKTLTQGHSTGVLSIGCDHRFVSLSGMVALVVEHRRIVVEINQAAVKSSDWVFSSHLLEIARVTAGGVP